jgi:hypothetical protein
MTAKIYKKDLESSRPGRLRRGRGDEG